MKNKDIIITIDSEYVSFAESLQKQFEQLGISLDSDFSDVRFPLKFRKTRKEYRYTIVVGHAEWNGRIAILDDSGQTNFSSIADAVTFMKK